MTGASKANNTHTLENTSLVPPLDIYLTICKALYNKKIPRQRNKCLEGTPAYECYTWPKTEGEAKSQKNSLTTSTVPGNHGPIPG